MSSSTPKNCTTCVHSYGSLGMEFLKCKRTGTYCEVAIRFPKICGGKTLPLYERKKSLFERVFSRRTQP